MSVPRLNVRLDLERSDRQGDGMGGYRTVWQQIGSLWAEMKAGAGKERGAEVGPESVVSWRISSITASTSAMIGWASSAGEGTASDGEISRCSPSGR